MRIYSPKRAFLKQNCPGSRKNPRILYVIGSLDVGGTEKQFYLLLKHLDRFRLDTGSRGSGISASSWWACNAREATT
ncbi:MAG: hypothetical protein JRI77_16915 [Deltaproteobacteria bacterium]|nr:hypothetical protein [Deltaproteobacteria bacterium]